MQTQGCDTPGCGVHGRALPSQICGVCKVAAVVGLLQQVVLPVVRVGGDELAANRLVDFAQDRFHLGQEVVGRISVQVLDAGLVETEGVAQLFCRGAQGGVDVSGSR